MLDNVKQKVKSLLEKEKSMHDWKHTFRVYENALRLCKEEKADAQIVGLSALLHDCDDYKVFGQESAEKLINTRRILAECGFEEKVKDEVLDIVSNLGFSKYLSGQQKLGLNGKIVQDADMLDAMGNIGIVRTIVFNAVMGSGVFFDEEKFPRENLTKESYQAKSKDEETAVNHMFEKLLKLRDLMYTQSGRREAEIRHKAMFAFLEEFFRELRCEDWQEYLHQFE